MKLCSVVCALLLFLFASVAKLHADDTKIFQSDCSDRTRSAQARIRCLTLVREGKISRLYFAMAYEEVAYAYFELEDFVQAITYTRKEIIVAGENMKSRLASQDLSLLEREALPKQMSRRYWVLGMNFGFARLKNTKSDSGPVKMARKNCKVSAALSRLTRVIMRRSSVELR
jgi:hypothetical protein